LTPHLPLLFVHSLPYFSRKVSVAQDSGRPIFCYAYRYSLLSPLLCIL
jgi:hypothetical protein